MATSYLRFLAPIAGSALLMAGVASSVLAGNLGRRCPVPCAVGESVEIIPVPAKPEAAPAPKPAPKPELKAAPAPITAPEVDLSSPLQVAAAPQSIAPGMLGDFNLAPNPNNLGGFARTKIADGFSPVPQCRVSTLYHYFNDVGPAGNLNRAFGYDIHRISVGVEQCFMDQLFSVAVRGYTEQLVDVGPTNDIFWEAGDMLAALKVLLYQTDAWSLSGGVALNIPTGSRPPAYPHTGSYQPFLGYLCNPSERLYVQGFYAVDIATHAGNVSFLWIDNAVGYWAYQNPGALLSGIAPTLELHMSFPLNNAAGAYNNQQLTTTVDNDQVLLGNVSEDILNLTTGLTLRFRDNIDLQLGLAMPISTDRQFTLETLVQLHIGY